VVRQRDLRAIGLLLLVVLAGTVLAQDSGKGAGADTKPAPWAGSGNEPAAGSTAALAVIATSEPLTPYLPPDARIPAPDDALRPLVSTTPKKQAEKEPVTTQPAPPAGPPSPASLAGIQPTSFVQPPTNPEGVKQDNPGQHPVGEIQRPGLDVAAPAAGLPPPPNVTSPHTTDPVPHPAAGPHFAGTGITLAVEGPAEVAPGQAGTFTIVARNVGAEVLAGVQVELPIPEAIRVLASEPPAERKGSRLAWNLGNVECGAERRLKFDLGAGEGGELHLCPTAQFTQAVGLRTRVIRPAFELTLNGPESATKGSRIAWRIGVANHSPDPMPHVKLTCRLSDGLAHAQGDSIQTDLPNGLAPGQVYNLELPVQVSKTGRQVLSLSASGDGGRTAQVQGIVRVNELTLALALEGPRQGRMGEDLVYRVQVSNPGSDASGPIRLTQLLPVGLEFTSASSGGTYNQSTQTITWTLDGLAGLHTHEAVFQVKAGKGGDWALSGAVQTEGLREVRVVRAVHVESPPTLNVDINVPDEQLGHGAVANYEVRIRNGGQTLASGVRLRMILPDSLLAVEASAPTQWHIQGQQVLFEPIDQMNPRVAAVYRIRVRGVTPGAGRFRVEVTADGLNKPVEQERTCRVQGPPGLR
jgi:uncharacterized repeat protein (TIGR01451 family)